MVCQIDVLEQSDDQCRLHNNPIGHGSERHRHENLSYVSELHVIITAAYGTQSHSWICGLRHPDDGLL